MRLGNCSYTPQNTLHIHVVKLLVLYCTVIHTTNITYMYIHVHVYTCTCIYKGSHSKHMSETWECHFLAVRISMYPCFILHFLAVRISMYPCFILHFLAVCVSMYPCFILHFLAVCVSMYPCFILHLAVCVSMYPCFILQWPGSSTSDESAVYSLCFPAAHLGQILTLVG